MATAVDNNYDPHQYGTTTTAPAVDQQEGRRGRRAGRSGRRLGGFFGRRNEQSSSSSSSPAGDSNTAPDQSSSSRKFGRAYRTFRLIQMVMAISHGITVITTVTACQNWYDYIVLLIFPIASVAQSLFQILTKRVAISAKIRGIVDLVLGVIMLAQAITFVVLYSVYWSGGAENVDVNCKVELASVVMAAIFGFLLSILHFVMAFNRLCCRCFGKEDEDEQQPYNVL